MEPQAGLTATVQKPSYAPPKATFIPLKLEERLLACSKYPILQTTGCGTDSAS